MPPSRVRSAAVAVAGVLLWQVCLGSQIASLDGLAGISAKHSGHMPQGKRAVQRRSKRELVVKKLLEEGVATADAEIKAEPDIKISDWNKLPLTENKTTPCFIVGPQCYPTCVHSEIDHQQRSSICLPGIDAAPSNDSSCYELQDATAEVHAAKFYLPSVIGIGPAKSGTTTLFGMLYTHPSILTIRGPRGRFGAGGIWEPGYFSNFDYIFSQGLVWYSTFFPVSDKARIVGDKVRDALVPHYEKPDGKRLRTRSIIGQNPIATSRFKLTPSECNERQIAIEKSPWYISHPVTPYRIRRLMPDVKIIATLRDPVERAFSGYCHINKRSFALGTGPAKTFMETVTAGIETTKEFLACRDHYLPYALATANITSDANTTLYDLFAASPRNSSIEQLQRLDETLWYSCSVYRGFGGNNVRSRFANAVDEVVWYGVYYEHILRYSALFPEDQLKLVFSDEMYANMEETLADIADWVEIDPKGFGTVKNFNDKTADIERQHARLTKGTDLAETLSPITNLTAYRDPEAMELLRDFYRAYDAKLEELVGRKVPWSS